jgi:hypothetical protein
LRFKLLGVALRALGLFLAVNQRLKLVVAFLADVFVDGHFTAPWKFPLSIRINLWGVRKFHIQAMRSHPVRSDGIPGG